MKKIIIILAIAFPFFIGHSYGQNWTLIGNDIHNNNSGNVGIGTSTPVKSLTVVSTTIAPLVAIRNEGGNGGAGFYMYDQTSNSQWIFKTTTTGSFKIRDQINGINVIEVEKGALANSLYVKAGGNIGIGTSNPSSKLSVNGKIGCKEVEVTLSGWSDYVFADNYKLRSLSDVETYIKENKHLPDVPSEKEVLKNGVNIGEMNSVLLKKIEELTLYMIQLKKENEQMKGQIEQLMEK
jgi:hypothetical protein